MEIGIVVGAVAQVGPAVVLLSAALTKALDLKGFRQTLTKLGIRHGAMAVAVVGAELITAGALFVAPAAWWPRALVGVLAIGFAAAGLMAVLTKRRVACRCFGSAGRGMLGWRQVAWVPVWLGAAGIAHWRAPGWTADVGLLLVACTVLGLLAVRVPAGVRLVRTLHDDRMALLPIYAGVRPGDPGALPLDGSGG
jgi:hypothetical protein